MARGSTGPVANGVDGTVRLKSGANVLTVVNGRFDLGASYNFAQVVLAGAAWLVVTGNPTVTQPLLVTPTNKVSLNTVDALANT